VLSACGHGATAGRENRFVIHGESKTPSVAKLRHFVIDDCGAHVGERFQDLRGVRMEVLQPGRTQTNAVSRSPSGAKTRRP
jgi:hypothetical protein